MCYRYRSWRRKAAYNKIIALTSPLVLHITPVTIIYTTEEDKQLQSAMHGYKNTCKGSPSTNIHTHTLIHPPTHTHLHVVPHSVGGTPNRSVYIYRDILQHTCSINTHMLSVDVTAGFTLNTTANAMTLLRCGTPLALSNQLCEWHQQTAALGLIN